MAVIDGCVMDRNQFEVRIINRIGNIFDLNKMM